MTPAQRIVTEQIQHLFPQGGDTAQLLAIEIVEVLREQSSQRLDDKWHAVNDSLFDSR